ncbi:urea amidolyase associated protein UAAP1 [Salibacterium sp. K-3]
MFETILEPGAKWSNVIAKGKAVRFTALGDGANLSALLYNSRNTTDRYNMPDTLKAQHTSKLTKGNVLMSDNGRVLASIVEDSLGWHDPVGGAISRGQVDEQFGKTSFQEVLNDYLRSGEENIIKELVRNGLTMRDIVPNVNFFSKIAAAPDGTMQFEQGHAKEGDSVTLRMEMDTLLILSNTPNPQDPALLYPSVPVKMEVSETRAPDETDYCVTFRPENKRAFENTWNYHALTV